MFFHIKRIIGWRLFEIGYLAELNIDYLPKRRVYFGRTMRQWKKTQTFRQEMRKFYPMW